MRRDKGAALTFALMLCAAAGCGQTSAPSAEQAASSQAVSSKVMSSQTASSSAPASSEEAASKEELAGLTLEQKIGQMFFLCFRKDAAGGNLLTCTDEVQKELRTIQPGGIILFGENIHDTEQVRTLIRSMEAECTTPPFVGVDQEGGTVQRVGRTDLIPATKIPPMRSVSQTGDTELARNVGQVIGSELSVFGFNLDFAPDCDVLTNPKNTAIGSRSFSGSAAEVAKFSTAVADGIRREGILPVCKHFPGQGGASADTHTGYAAVPQTLGELRKTELVPFQAQIDNGAEAVMVGHISLPKITGSDTPASLSPEIIRKLLRSELGFQGIVITDALNMGAVANHYSSGRAAVLAVEAGADILLMPADPEAAFHSVQNAVKSGQITEERIDDSVVRILALKKKYGLFTPKKLGDQSLLGCEEHRAVIARVGNSAK
jgi:beta-N-acetylhexosaminidase